MGSSFILGLVGWGRGAGLLRSEANLGIVQFCAGLGVLGRGSAERTQFGRDCAESDAVSAWPRGMGEALRIF